MLVDDDPEDVGATYSTSRSSDACVGDVVAVDDVVVMAGVIKRSRRASMAASSLAGADNVDRVATAPTTIDCTMSNDERRD